jgi:hypothetical protein
MEGGKSIVLRVLSIQVYCGNLPVAMFVTEGLGEKAAQVVAQEI